MLTLTKGTEIQGRYVIHDVVGTGGYASVWKASDKQLNRDVALKRLLKQGVTSPDEELAKILEEAQKHAQLVHTNIVQVYDVIECEGEHLIVMEYVDGPSLHTSLRDLAKRGDTLPMDQAIAILGDVLEGVAFAHDRQTIHRDLSPSNILLTGNGTPKIGDFGIARVVVDAQLGVKSTPHSHAGTGNPNFMSPEQARGEQADYSSDLFMVGIIGYLLLTGRHPFAHPSGLFTIPELIRDDNYNPEPPRPPSNLTTSQQRLFREYSAVVMRLLHRERAGRFKEAQEALDEIDAVTPVVDCPSCGERIPEHFKYCGFCGAELAARVAAVASTPNVPASADNLVEQGFHESEYRRWASAIALYERALAIEQNHKKALRNLGFALNRVRRFEEADNALSRGLALPSEIPVHRASMLVERSFARASLKNYQQALDDIDEALRIRKSVRALYSRARIHLFMGNREGARGDALEVLRIETDHPGAIRMLDQLSGGTSGRSAA
jgi:serine/threonine protein kinase